MNWHESYSESQAEIIPGSSERSSPTLRRATLLPMAAVLLPYTAANEMGRRGVFKDNILLHHPNSSPLASLSDA